MNWTTVVSADALHGALGDTRLVLLDARVVLTDRAAGRAVYLTAHLPGAHYASLESDLSAPPGATGRSEGRHPWPEGASVNERLRTWGVGPDSQVVVYDANDAALAASRVWWMLQVMGHRNVAVLDGGFDRWTALGLPVQSGEVAAGQGAFNGTFDTSRLLDADAVQAHLEDGGMLIDARAPERFRGEVEPLDTRAGHVPGAINRPFALNLRDRRFKPTEELTAEFTALLAGRAATEVVVMCGSGVTACHHLVAMAHAGLPGAKLFTGSWSGWIETGERPIATGP